jgi:hypothetical protein
VISNFEFFETVIKQDDQISDHQTIEIKYLKTDLKKQQVLMTLKSFKND